MLSAEHIQQLISLVQQAGEQTLTYWQTDMVVTDKADSSPVTAADMAAHKSLMTGLQQLTPEIPILSEEACEIPLTERQQWHRWWLVDPLDGTKEFIAGSSEFTVNVALIEQGKPLFGVVGTPAQNKIYYGGAGVGAWCLMQETLTPLTTSPSQQPLRVLGSRRHDSIEQRGLISFLQQQTTIELFSIGSSLKFCWLAQGLADLYPRLSPTSQWDTAAAQAVLEGAGGEVLDSRGQPLDYSARPDFLNPHFIALPRNSTWRALLLQYLQSHHSSD